MGLRGKMIFVYCEKLYGFMEEKLCGICRKNCMGLWRKIIWDVGKIIWDYGGKLCGFMVKNYIHLCSEKYSPVLCRMAVGKVLISVSFLCLCLYIVYKKFTSKHKQ